LSRHYLDWTGKDYEEIITQPLYGKHMGLRITIIWWKNFSKIFS